MFDQHVHSSFSFDSNEDLKNYINVSNNSDIITTEHLDFENPIINYKDSSIDYLKYIKQIKSLNKKYSNKFFSGIEIGYTQKSEKRIEDLISTGKSSVLAAQALQEAGLEVLGVVAIFSYNLNKAKEKFDEAKIPFSTLTNYDVLLEVAKETGLIGNKENQVLVDWRNNL